MRALQPAQGEPHARGVRPASPDSAEAAAAGALHQARGAARAGDLGAVPGPARRGDGLVLLHGEPARRPLAPRAGVEPALAAVEIEAVEDDARRDARPAVGD